MKLFVLVVLAVMAAAAVAQTVDTNDCVADGVTSQAECEAQCSSCTCAFQETGGSTGCGCVSNDGSTAYACVSASSGSTPSSPTSSGDQSAIDNIKDLFKQYLPEGCDSTVNKVVTEKTVACFSETDFATVDLADATDVGVVCENECVGRMVGAVETMAESGCLPPVDETTPLALSGILQTLNALQDTFIPFLTGACAMDADGELCANVIPILMQYATAPSMFAAADCQSILDYGNCIGNVAVAVNANPTIFGGDPVNTTTVIDALDSHCAGEGIDGIKSASESTEAPADLASNSAGSVSGVIALVATAVAAAIMA